LLLLQSAHLSDEEVDDDDVDDGDDLALVRRVCSPRATTSRASLDRGILRDPLRRRTGLPSEISLKR
jgi:hypothetical protein